MRIKRIRGPHPWRESVQEAFGAPVCRLFGHATPVLGEVHYEVRPSVLIGSIELPVPAPTRHVDRAALCWRCGARVGD